KHTLILAILGHSTNHHFNSLQCIVGLFLESRQAPEIIVELVAHMGVSVSNSSLCNMIRSLHIKARNRLKTLPLTNKIYDNYDIDFLKG
ncbi:hypothetical protein GYMLUDRAFT_168640, partial [Collybiopsis luxurians FD-317 M1]